MTSISCPAGTTDRINEQEVAGMEARNMLARGLYKRPHSLSAYLPRHNSYLRSERSYIHNPSSSTEFELIAEPDSIGTVNDLGEMSGSNDAISVTNAVKSGLHAPGSVRYQANVWLSDKLLDTSKHVGGPFI